MKTRFLIILFLAVCLFPVFGSLDTYLHLRIVELENARAPEFLGDRIIFTYKSERPVRSVCAIFGHEGFGAWHVFARNDNNVFFLIYPVPKNTGLLKYRLIVDGLVMNDPLNSFCEEDVYGIVYSLLKIEKVIQEEVHNPVFANPGNTRIGGANPGAVSFVFYSKPGKIVSIVGTFNDWDPYMHLLKEESPGIYWITLQMSGGDHFYYFIVDGQKMLDYLNPNPVYIRNRENVNYFRFP